MLSLLALRYFLALTPSYDLAKLEHTYAVDGICFEWTSSGIDAVAWTTDADQDGRPDFLDSLRNDFRDASKILRDSFQLRPIRLDRNNPNCSLHVALVDLESIRIAEGAGALGLVAGHPSNEYVLILLENDFDPSGTAPKINSVSYPSKGYRGIVFHEMMHLHTPVLATPTGKSTEVFREQVAQWFTATRSGVMDEHILSDSTDAIPLSLFDPAYRYSTWFWLEDLETRKGTSAILDWIHYRSKAAESLPTDWNQIREDSLLTQWFRSRKEYVQTWQSDFVKALGLLASKFKSPTMPNATAAIQGHTRTPIARPISLDTRGYSERIIKLPPLSWVVVQQPRSWIQQGGQTLTARVDPVGSQAYAYGFGLENQPSMGGWVPQGYNLYGIAKFSDTLKPSPDVSGRVAVFMSGPDSTTLHLTAYGSSDICRARPLSISKPDLGNLGALDDGDILTWIDPTGDSSFTIDFGSDIPLVGIDLVWRDPQAYLNAFDVELYSDERPIWETFRFPVSLTLSPIWSINFSSGYVRRIRLNPTMWTSSRRRLSEIAIWTKGQICREQSQTSSNHDLAERIVRPSIHAGPGQILLSTPKSGRLEWRGLDGKLLGTDHRVAGKWIIPSPRSSEMVLAIWISDTDKLVARVPMVR